MSGEPEDIFKTDEKVIELFPEDKTLVRWIKLARDKVQFQGLPARICWLNYIQRSKFGVELNKMVASGELSSPVVIGRDHLDTCLLYTSDAADDTPCVDLGGRRIIKK